MAKKAFQPYTQTEVGEIVPRIKETVLRAQGEEELVDTLGDIRSIEVGLSNLRRSTAMELDDYIEGDRWRMKRPRKAMRSFNTSRLLARFSKALDLTVAATVSRLLADGVISLNWNWSMLKNYAEMHDVSLTIAQHEVEDGDVEDVGVYYKSGYPTYESLV